MASIKNYRDLDYNCGVKDLDGLDLVAAATEGQRKLASQRKPEPGMVRGGSVGAIINNQIHGICHRKAYLRYHGIEVPLPTEIELMTNQGEKNEEIWFNDLQYGLPEHLYVIDQEQLKVVWNTVFGIDGKMSQDLLIWDRRTDLPFRGLELKNLSSVSTAKSVHYELRPKEDHIIQAANYSLRIGDKYLNGKPLPYQLVYSSRSIWQMYAMGDKAKQAIVEKGWDVDWKWGKPSAILPFHRVYHLDWNLDGTLRYWTPGLRQWVQTQLTRESIDNYYDAVSIKIDKQNHLGPRPTTQHLDGKSAYSPCGYCDWSSICDQFENASVDEFKDQARLYAKQKKEERGLDD